MRLSESTYTSNTVARSRLTLGWLLPFLFFVLLGVSSAFIFSSLIRRHSEVVVFVAILLAPLLLLFAVFVVPLALTKFREFRKHLTTWHGLWMLLFISGLVLRTRDTQDIHSSPTDSAAGFRILLVSLVGFVLLITLGLRRNDWWRSLFSGLIGALTAYCLVSAVSTVWSVYPAWTLYKSLEYLVDVCLIAAFLAIIDSMESYRTLLNWTWTLYGLLLGSVWLSAIIRPQTGFLRAGSMQREIGLLPIQLAGVFPVVGSNKVGDLGALLGVLALSRLLTTTGTLYRTTSDRLWYLGLLLFSFVSLILSQTRSALAGFLLGATFLLLYSKRWKLITLLSLAGTSLLTLQHVRDKLMSFLQRGENATEIASLSSRVDWWAFAWHKFMQHPWTGLGAYAAGRFAVMSKVGDTATSSVHSDYIEILVGTSAWGLLPMLVAIFGTWWILARYLRSPLLSLDDRQLTVEVIAMFTVVTARSLMNDMLTFHAALMFLVIVGFAEFIRRQRKYGELTARKRFANR